MTQRGKTPRKSRTKLGLFAVLAATGLFAAHAVFAGNMVASHMAAAVERFGIEFDVDDATSVLPGSLTFDGVHVAHAGGSWSVDADRVVCELDLLAFLFAKNEIELLRADGVVVHVPGNVDLPLWKSAVLAEPRTVVLGSSVATPALPVRSEGIVVRRIEASGSALSLGEYHLKGPLRYEAADVHLTDSTTWEEVIVEVLDAIVLRQGRRMGTVEGRGRASAPAGEAGTRSSIWQRARVHVDLDGRIDSLSPWVGDDEGALAVTGASHEMELEFGGGSLRLGRVRLRAATASFVHLDESETRISDDMELSLRLGVPMEERADLKAGTIVLLDTHGTRWAKLSDFRAKVHPSPASRAGTSTSEPRLALSASQAHFAALASTIEAPLEGELSVQDVDPSRGALSLGPGALRIPSGQLSAANTGEVYEFEAGLAINEARLSADEGLAFEGRAHVRGEDSGMLLDIADASETVRWTLSVLEDQSFVVRGDITREAGGVRLDPLSFESDGISASGALLATRGITKGAFLVQGPLPVGVLLEQPGASAEVPVDAEWLARQLTELRAEERDIWPHP